MQTRIGPQVSLQMQVGWHFEAPLGFSRTIACVLHSNQLVGTSISVHVNVNVNANELQYQRLW